MILSRKKISKLLNTNNQSNKRFKKRGINKKAGRTFRNKRKDINLRKKSLKHRRSKNKKLLTKYYENSSEEEELKGGADSGAVSETDVPSQKTQEIDIQLEEDKEMRVAKEKKMDDDEDAEPDEIVEYRLKEDTPGLKKFQDYLDVLNKRAEQIGKVYEEASQRLKLFEIIQKELMNKKKTNLKQGDKSKQTGDDLKRLGGAIMQLKLMRNKYKMIKDVYKNDTNTANEIKEKVYYEYTEPKSRIKFYSDIIEGFSSYDKRKGVTINFPGSYTANPFFVEDDFAGEDLLKQMKQQVIRRSGWLFDNSTRPIVEQKTIDALQFYMDKRDDLTLKSDEKDAATKSSEEIRTDVEERQQVIEDNEKKTKEFEEKREQQLEQDKKEGTDVSAFDNKNKANEKQAQTDASDKKIKEMIKNDKEEGDSKIIYGGTNQPSGIPSTATIIQENAAVVTARASGQAEVLAAQREAQKDKADHDLDLKKQEEREKQFLKDKAKVGTLKFKSVKQDALKKQIMFINMCLDCESKDGIKKLIDTISETDNTDNMDDIYTNTFKKNIRTRLEILKKNIELFENNNNNQIQNIENEMDGLSTQIKNTNDGFKKNSNTNTPATASSEQQTTASKQRA